MRSAILCLFVAGVCVAAPICSSLPRVYNGWEPTTAPSPSEIISLRLALRHRNVDKLQEELMAVSDPRSERYGQHYTREEVAALVGPADKEVDAVVGWLVEAGAQEIEFSHAREYCRFRISVEKAERLLSVKLMQFKHFEIPRTLIRASTPYCIPEHMDEAVDFVDGIHFFPTRRYPAQRTQTGSDPAAPVDPDYLYKAYQVSEPTRATRGSSQAPVQIGPEFYSPSDLQTFEADYCPAVKGQKIENTYGLTQSGTRISLEANLDVQYIIAMGNHVNTSIYVSQCDYVSTSIENCFVTYTETVLGQTSPPLVQTISYGEYGGYYDNRTVQRLDQDFQKMGLRGISILVASGDNGVGCNSRCTSFEFDFPSSPHITMVGATYFDSSSKEHGATLSSGGFSGDYYRPSYQNTAVKGYFNSGVKLPSSSLYEKNGRAYPDVAAAGEYVRIVSDGKKTAVDGTSCSAPIFGGLISLINNHRLSKGKSPMGFLNPWLYQNPHMFNPVSDGNNLNCPSKYGCCCAGFDGAKGWDPVTGLGTPNFPKMLNAA